MVNQKVTVAAFELGKMLFQQGEARTSRFCLYRCPLNALRAFFEGIMDAFFMLPTTHNSVQQLPRCLGQLVYWLKGSVFVPPALSSCRFRALEQDLEPVLQGCHTMTEPVLRPQLPNKLEYVREVSVCCNMCVTTKSKNKQKQKQRKTSQAMENIINNIKVKMPQKKRITIQMVFWTF